ncbi:MAG: hypothetical protein ABEJ95_02760 [Candidatus Nanohalobium sp.]
MDIKILAAVLGSLTAVFAGAGGGVFSDVTPQDQAVTMSDTSMLQDLPIIGEIFRKPEPSNEIHAKMEIDGPATVKINNGGLKAENLTEINASTMTIDSDQDIKLRKFTGKVKFGNTSRIEGKATGLKTSGVNINTSIRLDTGLKTPLIKISETHRSQIRFKQASISPVKDSDFPLNTNRSNIKINSFTGDIEIYPGRNTLILDGKVSSLKAGKTSYGN